MGSTKADVHDVVTYTSLNISGGISGFEYFNLETLRKVNDNWMEAESFWREKRAQLRRTGRLRMGIVRMSTQKKNVFVYLGRLRPNTGACKNLINIK